MLSIGPGLIAVIVYGRRPAGLVSFAIAVGIACAFAIPSLRRGNVAERRLAFVSLLVAGLMTLALILVVWSMVGRE